MKVIRRRRVSVPKVLMILGLLIPCAYVLVAALGWREFATVLSGTYLSAEHLFDVFRCVAFLCAYFGAVVVAPILLLAAPVWLALDRFVPSQRVDREYREY